MRALPLDILRIVLCLLVIDFHYGKLVHAGPLAVVGFFVLSGYWLEKEFEASDNLNAPRFYKKKALALLPEYLITSVPIAIFTALFPTIYTVDFSQARGSSFALLRVLEAANNPSWFMTCLFLFFAIAPILFCLHRVRWGIPLAFVSALLYGHILYSRYGASEWLYTSAQINIIYFLGGMLARQIMRGRSLSPIASATLIFLSAAGLLALICLTRSGALLSMKFYHHRFIECALFMVLVPMLYRPTALSSNLHRPVICLSSMTYAMYLFHAPVKRASICLLTHLTSYTEEQILTPGAYALFLLLTIAAAAAFQPIKRFLVRKLSVQ